MKEALLRAALAYAGRLRWPVFPLKPRSKDPLTPHGFKDATLDEKIIRGWWKKWPAANIAIPTGLIFWVLDIDPRNGGDASLMQLVSKYSALADTIRQITGGGGQQYLYLMPDQQKIICHNAVWPGIDVKGEGGYIVVPPSIHPSGNAYAWDTAKKSILEESLQPADPWLLTEILAATHHESNGGPFHLPEKISKGKQHMTLFKMGTSMRAKGLEEPEILAALWEINQNRCEQPGPRENIEKLARSICARYHPGETPKQPPPPKNIAGKAGNLVYFSNHPDPEPVIDPILYPGLTILGGRPKVGKSWFALQLALAVTSGQKLASYLEVKKLCRCRYLSLEDRERQIRARLHKLTGLEPWLEKVDFVFELDALMAGGAAALDRNLKEHPVEVLIVDSLLAAVKQSKRDNMDVMQADYNIVATLRELAEKHSLALILVAHTRKQAGDFLDLIQGTSGTTAAADAIWVLQRTPDGNANLMVTGREVETNTFGLKRDGSPAWIITGEGDEIAQSEARRDVLQLLRDEGPMKPSKLANTLHKSISGVHRLLAGLCDTGLIVRSSYGTYQIPRPGAAPINGKSPEEYQ